MYKTSDRHQITFFDFNQSCGMQLDENNEWVLLADNFPWHELEADYAAKFPSIKGRPAKPFRMALGALIIQKRKGLSDRELVKEIAENPYLQYFIGLDEFSRECPFRHNTLSHFRKRLDVDAVINANEVYLSKAAPTKEHRHTDGDGVEDIDTFIIDATCSPSEIRHPRDFMLLNDARKKLEEMIDWFNTAYRPWKKPRTYRKAMDKQYLAVAKMKKRPIKKLRSLIRKELGSVNRNLGYLEAYMKEGYAPPSKYVDYYLTILKLYEQQKYLFDNRKKSVPNRIVSIRQPYIRPIVRGKAAAAVEFGAKYEVEIDKKGHARLAKISFEAYNEGKFLIDAIESYAGRSGRYPERVLADKIYRTRENLDYCAKHGIRLSGPRLGRPSEKERKARRKEESKDNIDRIEAERFFSRTKRCFGAGLIRTRLKETTLASIALSIFVANIFGTSFGNIFLLCFWDDGEEGFSQDFIEIYDKNAA